MLKILVLFSCCCSALLIVNVECNSLLHIFKASTSTQAPTTTSTEATATATATTREPPLLVTNSNIPTVEATCQLVFKCTHKLRLSGDQKPCIKYCVKTIICPNAATIKGKADQCYQLDEQAVLQEHEKTPIKIVPVALIDFPCQPGYLPDSRGRCREVW